MSANNNSPIETSSAFARNSAHVALFVARVKPGGAWDYKQFSTSERNFERFGNFHYGAVGGAAGFTVDQLLRAAGFVQKWFGDSEGDGGSVNIANALTGDGGDPPFADQARDQDAIKEGFSYYIKKFVKKVCK